MTQVVAALIERDGKLLICQRPAHKARSLLWEFAGGKVEAGETAQQALIRECREELDVTVLVGEPYMRVEHVYPDISVELTLFRAAIERGEPRPLEHAQLRWVTREELPAFDFCPADEEIIASLARGCSAS